MSKNRLSTDCVQELNFNFFSEEPARTNFTEDEKKQVQKVLDAFWAQKDNAGKHLTETRVHQVCENNIENNRITTLKGSRNLR